MTCRPPTACACPTSPRSAPPRAAWPPPLCRCARGLVGAIYPLRLRLPGSCVRSAALCPAPHSLPPTRGGGCTTAPVPVPAPFSSSFLQELPEGRDPAELELIFAAGAVYGNGDMRCGRGRSALPARLPAACGGRSRAEQGLLQCCEAAGGGRRRRASRLPAPASHAPPRHAGWRLRPLHPLYPSSRRMHETYGEGTLSLEEGTVADTELFSISVHALVVVSPPCILLLFLPLACGGAHGLAAASAPCRHSFLTASEPPAARRGAPPSVPCADSMPTPCDPPSPPRPGPGPHLAHPGGLGLPHPLRHRGGALPEAPRPLVVPAAQVRGGAGPCAALRCFRHALGLPHRALSCRAEPRSVGHAAAAATAAVRSAWPWADRAQGARCAPSPATGWYRPGDDRRAMQTLGLALGIAGFGIGFAIAGGWDGAFHVHRNLGLAATVLGIAQVRGWDGCCRRSFSSPGSCKGLLLKALHGKQRWQRIGAFRMTHVPSAPLGVDARWLIHSLPTAGTLAPRPSRPQVSALVVRPNKMSRWRRSWDFWHW